MKMHIGKKIKEAVERSGMTITEFAEKINYSRRNIYSIFQKESLDTALLLKIGEVLEVDFFSFYSYSTKYKSARSKVEDPSVANEYAQNRIKELLKEVEYLKEINALLKTQVEELSQKRNR